MQRMTRHLSLELLPTSHDASISVHFQFYICKSLFNRATHGVMVLTEKSTYVQLQFHYKHWILIKNVDGYEEDQHSYYCC